MNPNWRDEPNASWSNEPDTVEFEHRGLTCTMKRNPLMGHWCGYVHLPAGHKWYGLDYDDEAVRDVSVHGGLTYAALHKGSGAWMLGFDCAHYDDLIPAINAGYPFADAVYRDRDWVDRELRQLADQCAD